MITAVQVDDEANAREFLRARLNDVAPEVNVLGEAFNIDRAQQLIAQHRPRLVFLDVEMPGGTGFDLLQRLGRWEFEVIFTTGHLHYAVQAIRFSALDYLVKPVQGDELRAAIDRFLQREGGTPEEVKNAFLNNIAQRDERALKLTLTSGDRSYFIDPADVTWCEADINYTNLHLKDERRFVSARTLKDYEDMLTPIGFLRTHRSYLVNRAHVDHMDRAGFLVLRSGKRVEVSSRRKEEVARALAS